MIWRTAAGTLFATVFAGGIAAMIGTTAVQAGSPYFRVLIYSGIVGLTIGGVGLLGLLFFPAKR